MNKLINTLLFCFAVAIVDAQTLDAYLQEAEANSPMLQASKAEVEAAWQRVPQFGLPDPTLRVSALGQMAETRVGQQMTRISLEQMFPWFGTLAAQKNMAALNARAAFELYQDARNKLFYQVRAAYYPLYEVRRQVILQMANREILATYKTLATSRFESGRGRLADVLRVDIMLQEIDTDIKLLQTKEQPLLVAFNRLLNRDDNTGVVIDSLLSITPIHTPAYDSILANNPQLTALQQKQAAARAQENVARKQGLPNLGVGIEYIVVAERPGMTFEDNGKDSYMPMVSVTLPIYRKKYNAAASEARYVQQSYKAMQQATGNMLIAEFEMARYDLDRSREEATLYSQQIVRTQQVIELLLTSFGNGEGDIEEILRMQQDMLNYKLNEVTSITNYYQAAARLQYIAGTGAR